MGAKPIAMLSFAGFPRGTLPWEVLERILLGGAEKAREAGVDVVGGHTVDDPEPKCGYAVVGVVHPDRVVANASGQIGDVLVLTKPLGSGILSTAIKRELIGAEDVDRVVGVMAALNRDAADAMLEIGVHACTDITGYGLLGHLQELVAASEVAAVIRAGDVPLMPRVLDLIDEGVVPGGTWTNLESVAPFVAFGDEVSEAWRVALADAQTSGGLLIAVPPDRSEQLVQRLREKRTHVAAMIGELVEGEPGTIRVEPQIPRRPDPPPPGGRGRVCFPLLGGCAIAGTPARRNP